MNVLILLGLALFLSITGEILCKLASGYSDIRMYLLMFGGALCWGFCAIVWTSMYKLKSIVEGIALFNPAQLAILALVGVLVFHEPLSLKIVVAMCLTAVCVYLLV